MCSKNNTLFFLIIHITTIIMVTCEFASEQEINSLPDYDEHLFKKESQSLRQRFLKKNIENHKVRILDELSNITIYVDGIPHYDIERFEAEKDRINKIENGFQSLLRMKGVKYTYKRGFHWRTWREIDNEGRKSIICYICKSAVNTTCKDCFNNGYWVMEEKLPPCPYEILSMPNDNQLCTIHFSQYNNIPSLCPTLVNVNDVLSDCNNPIETEWKISRKYNDDDSESTLSVICGGRESCQIFTIYTVLPDSILFRIINSSNHVIYSRVMRTGHKNYACVENCGIVNKKTKAIIKNDNHIVLNLMESNSVPHKNKRENVDSFKTTYDHKVIIKPPKNLLFLSKNVLHFKSNDTIGKKWTTIVPVFNGVNFFTKTLCKKLEEAYKEDNSSDNMET